MRLIPYRTESDEVDEYLRMGEATEVQNLRIYSANHVAVYSYQFFCQPTRRETKLLLRSGEKLGFTGLKGSIDCCEYVWKN